MSYIDLNMIEDERIVSSQGTSSRCPVSFVGAAAPHTHFTVPERFRSGYLVSSLLPRWNIIFSILSQHIII
jgi:hypothetical protein